VVRSAGISTLYLGPLQSNPDPHPKVREYLFVCRAVRKRPPNRRWRPIDVRGVFLNGVPIYNQFSSVLSGPESLALRPLAASRSIQDAHGNAQDCWSRWREKAPKTRDDRLRARRLSGLRTVAR